MISRSTGTSPFPFGPTPAIGLNYKTVTLASEKRQANVPLTGVSQPELKNQSSQGQLCHVSCRTNPSFPTNVLAYPAVCEPVPVGA